MDKLTSNLIRKEWHSGPENYAKGMDWFKVLYKDDVTQLPNVFGAHKDFDFFTGEITYGLCLSDHSILGPVETELVTLTGIMIQNVYVQTAWHLRAFRRLGIEMGDVELVQQCVSFIHILWECIF